MTSGRARRRCIRLWGMAVLRIHFGEQYREDKQTALREALPPDDVARTHRRQAETLASLGRHGGDTRVGEKLTCRAGRVGDAGSCMEVFGRWETHLRLAKRLHRTKSH